MGCIKSKVGVSDDKCSTTVCITTKNKQRHSQDEEVYGDAVLNIDTINLHAALASDPAMKRANGAPNLVAGRYQITGDAIACGAFGCVYKATDLKEPGIKGKLYAVKVENLDCEYPQLGHESRMYKVLEGVKGIPRSYLYEEKDNTAVLVMDMLGDSLQKLFGKMKNAFSVKSCLMLAEQMITRLQSLHEENYVHRDLKPANFCMGYPGTKERNTVFLLDFGLTKKWRNHLTKDIRPFEQRYYGTVGTDMFASRVAHQGMEQARKDDLESLGYIFLYFMKSLPWANNLEGMETEEILTNIRDLKKNKAVHDYSTTIPREFMDYLNICRNMKFAEDPDYEKLRNLFRGCAKKLNIPYPYDYKFDWDA